MNNKIMLTLTDFFEELNKELDKINDEKEEEKAKVRKSFETEDKIYNRGTVVAAMADKQWSDYDMENVLKNVRTSEQAEAAVGLIERDYDSYSICRILKKL